MIMSASVVHSSAAHTVYTHCMEVQNVHMASEMHSVFIKQRDEREAVGCESQVETAGRLADTESYS